MGDYADDVGQRRRPVSSTPTGACFKCKQQGHWYKDCPAATKSPPSSPTTKSQPSSSSTPAGDFDLPVVHCPCGAGLCTVRTSRTNANPDRKFYNCPRRQPDTKCGFFKWCDTMMMGSPKSEVPVCPCGAGRCSVHKEMAAGSNKGRRYFTCRVPKGQGACSFFQWEDAELNTAVNEDVEEGKHANYPESTRSEPEVTHIANGDLGKGNHANAPQSAGNNCEVTDAVNVDLGEDKHADVPQPAVVEVTQTSKIKLGRGSNLGFEHLKRTRNDLSMAFHHRRSPNYDLGGGIVFGFEYSKRLRMDLSMTGIKLPSAEVKLPPTESSEHNEPSGTLTPTANHSQSKVAVSENDNSCYSVAPVQNTESRVSSMDKAFRASCVSETEIFCQKLEFSGQISVIKDTITGDLIFLIHEIFGFHVKGWLGRLVFPPLKGVIVPPPKPFFCGVFPSFNAITIPEDTKAFHTSGSIVLPHSPSNKHEKHSSETPVKDVQVTIVRGELSVEQQAVRSFRSNLLTLLKSMDPRDHKHMELVANPILDALEHLSADNRYFRERVKEFIHHASVLGQIELPISSEPSSQDLIDRYNREKARFRDVSRDQSEAMNCFKASCERNSLLCEEASLLKKMLFQIEKQLSCSEMEISKLKTRMDETSKAKMECERDLQALDEDLRLCRKREEEQRAAKEAFEEARNQLIL